MTDEKTQRVVENVMTGNLANQIKENMRYSVTGFIAGAVLGILIATIAGKCKICYGVIGGVIGGGTGYLISRRKEESK